jgi:hypothetical protein
LAPSSEEAAAEGAIVPADSSDTQQWARDHRAAWEVVPLVEMVRGERRHVGYTLSLYGRIPMETPPGPERQEAVLAIWKRLRGIAQSLEGLGLEGERVEVAPFDAAGRLRPENDFVPEVLLEARVVHAGAYLAPVGADERAHLEPLERRLRDLGFRPGHW